MALLISVAVDWVQEPKTMRMLPGTWPLTGSMASMDIWYILSSSLAVAPSMKIPESSHRHSISFKRFKAHRHALLRVAKAWWHSSVFFCQTPPQHWYNCIFVFSPLTLRVGLDSNSVAARTCSAETGSWAFFRKTAHKLDPWW